jgi:hypothetical protein
MAMLVALALVACGKKGPPVAPERRVPAVASELRASVESDAIVVTWRNPGRRADESSLKNLATVKLYRREEADGAPPKPAILSWGQVVGYDEIASIRLDAPAPAVVQGDTVRWDDRRGLRFGRRYVYVVVAADSQGRASAPSARLAVSFLAAPRPPRDVTAAAGDRQVTLRWTPPAALIDGTPVTGEVRYMVLRGVGAEAALTAISPEPVPGTAFTDTGVVNDTTYRYAVRAVRIEPTGTARGEAARPVTAMPVDTTPPSAPTGLVGVPSAAGVRLAWNRSPEADVAAYAVYRAAPAGGFTRVATTTAAGTVFVDRDVEPRATYRYVVTALDGARTPNESPRSNEVTVTIP